MDFLLDIALKSGFKLTRGLYLDFSTMRTDGLFNEFKHKDGRIIIWGLSERNKPPTLICPKPIIRKKVNALEYLKQYQPNVGKYETNHTIILNESYNDCINELLNKISHQEIFEQMFLRTKVYDLNEI